MSQLDMARRRLMCAFFATLGAILVLLATWSHFLDIPSPMQIVGAADQAVPWSSISVAGLAFIVAAVAWWLADRGVLESNRVAGNCRECGARFDHDFCIRCGSTRVAG